MDAKEAARIYIDMSRLFSDPDQLAAYYVAMQPDCTFCAFLSAVDEMKGEPLGCLGTLGAGHQRRNFRTP